MIPVNKPFLPPKKEYQEYLDGIWQREWLTNNGELVQNLEEEISKYLGAKDCVYVTNGTIALQLGIKSLELSGEVITTPFSYVATSSSLVWEACTPVFADIDKHTFNIDPIKVEELITPETTAILATHVFGNPCDIPALQEVANKHSLKLIFDAAHCFGVTFEGQSVYNFGDISIASLHATKVFHSVEGGLVFPNAVEKRKIELMRNFGHDGPGKFSGLGINGKNSELHAAMGLVNLNYVQRILEKRKTLSERYHLKLANSGFVFQKWNLQANKNYAYMPILFKNETELLNAVECLERRDIHGRRYFYPSLNHLPYVGKTNVPIAEEIASRIYCLPLYFDLEMAEVDEVCEVLLD